MKGKKGNKKEAEYSRKRKRKMISEIIEIIEREVLKEIKRVCERNNIDYEEERRKRKNQKEKEDSQIIYFKDFL